MVENSPVRGGKAALTYSSAAKCDQALRALCLATGLDKDAEQILALFESLCELGCIRHLPPTPRWSGVTDDCTPIELSIALSQRRACVRFLIEAQDDRCSALAYWEAAERITRYLGDQMGANLEILDVIGSLFVPTDPNALFAAWHAVEFSSDRPPLFKLYMNLNAQGQRLSTAVLSEALERLKFGAAVPAILQLCTGDDRLTHLSVDLTSRTAARVKVYMRHFRISVAGLNERAARLGLGIASAFGDVCNLVCAVPGVLWQRPVMTCYQLTPEDRSRPTQASLYIPLSPYASDDEVARGRLLNLLEHFGTSTRVYSQSYEALAGDAASCPDGLHTYVAYKASGADSQINIYFSPRLYQSSFGRLALDPPRFWPSPVEV